MLGEKLPPNRPPGPPGETTMPPHALCPDRPRLQLLLREGDTQPDAPAVREHVDGGDVYLAMELLEGETLADWLERVGRPAAPDILRLGREIAGGLAVIHGHGLVHRDVKPSNLWVQPGGRVKILDFGLARFLDDG